MLGIADGGSGSESVGGRVFSLRILRKIVVFPREVVAFKGGDEGAVVKGGVERILG